MAQEGTDEASIKDSAQPTAPEPPVSPDSSTQPDNTVSPKEPGADQPSKERKKSSARESVNQPWPGMNRASVMGLPKPLTQKEQKAMARANVEKLVKAKPKKLQVKVGGHIYKISDVHKEGEMLCCTVKGYGITDDDFRFVNPPIRVPDGTKSVATSPMGDTFKVDNFKEDPNAALLQIVADAIKTVLKV